MVDVLYVWISTIFFKLTAIGLLTDNSGKKNKVDCVYSYSELSVFIDNYKRTNMLA